MQLSIRVVGTAAVPVLVLCVGTGVAAGVPVLRCTPPSETAHSTRSEHRT